jgi:8-oxo-dGTP pyrophosphatase MutT (NUDIX family)
MVFGILPKGKMELNESELECAVREVEEECGIDKIKLS